MSFLHSIRKSSKAGILSYSHLYDLYILFFIFQLDNYLIQLYTISIFFNMLVWVDYKHSCNYVILTIGLWWIYFSLRKCGWKKANGDFHHRTKSHNKGKNISWNLDLYLLTLITRPLIKSRYISCITPKSYLLSCSWNAF